MVPRMLLTTLSVLVAGGLPAHAEEAEEFLLADLGVRLDFPDDRWRMTRWSDWDFKAEYPSSAGTVLLFAWATPTQVPIAEPVEGWGSVYVTKIEDLQGSSPEVTRTEVSEVQGRKVALVDASFTFGEGGPTGTLHGATLEIAEKNLHLAVVSSERAAELAKAQRQGFLDELEVRTEPVRGKFAATVEAPGITTALPKGWRPPLESEMSDVVSPILGKIGVPDLEPCYTAIRPLSGGTADVLVTCQSGLLLGVVDEHSFAAVDEVVREAMFGTVPVDPAEPVDLGDRMGFVYAPTEGLAVGIVPYDQGVSRTWVFAEEAPTEDLRKVMAASSFSGPHPASVGDQVTYWVTHRPTSPVVLVPAFLLVVGVVGVGFLLTRGSRRNPYADFDDEA